jgi:alanyl-tRNA synthetase
MTANELRQKYLEFFSAKGHAIIPSASLLPENDPTVLFTTAGMHPLVPFLMGEKHPLGSRLANVQKCIRTQDINEVGDNRHDTFFEMLGNWSLGDYFKQEAIAMSFEFLTDKQWLGVDLRKLAVTVFAGDENAPRDEESAGIWQSLGIPEHKIAYLGKEDNWWGPAGLTGPCGPDTEMFYWIGPTEFPPKNSNPQTDEDNWLEIWNDVFMQYNKKPDKSHEPLKQKNVDTGMGLERVLMVMNGFDDVFQTDVFLPIVQKIETISGKKYTGEDKKILRIIADHIRTAVMILGDDRGVGPSNTGAGYVLRRLIRRAVRYAGQIGINDAFAADVADIVISLYDDIYPEVRNNEQFIKDELQREEVKFRETLEQGMRMFGKMAEDHKISGTEAFTLFSTYGFPFELTQELAREQGYEVDEVEFQKEMKIHSELSKTASAGQFKGGLADASDETKRLHTAAHLMLEALRRVLGTHVKQKGSNITPERLRFDVSHPDKITPEQIKQIEDLVNEQIKKDLPVHFEEMPLEQARKIGATGVFDSKYGEKVKVYFVGDGEQSYSKEICGGPHVTHTGELNGTFKIIKEESSSAGVRRIKAILE